MNRNTKISVLNKLIDKGYRTDADIKNYPLEEADELGLTRADEYTALLGIRRAVKERRLISYLAEEDRKGSDAKAAHAGKAKAADPQRKVTTQAESVNTEVKADAHGQERINMMPAKERMIP